MPHPRPTRTVALSAVALTTALLLAGCDAAPADTHGPPPAPERAPVRVPERAPAPAAASAAEQARRLVDLVNAHRRTVGCGPLRTDERLRSAARAHADDMAAHRYYAHRGPDGRDVGDRIGDAGYTWSRAAENIHRGPADAAAVVRDWTRSEAHRKVVEDCALKDTGAAVSPAAGGPWWVQDFATPR
ncbi:CAP domain-containing protein [Streptomyces sp. NPDC005805]|uniref:CAP domain-containing protein n=1 Tax=Streptomyces sp. NPDC005805 TaxID=3157068 RepID=UPI0033D2D8AB